MRARKKRVGPSHHKKDFHKNASWYLFGSKGLEEDRKAFMEKHKDEIGKRLFEQYAKENSA